MNFTRLKISEPGEGYRDIKKTLTAQPKQLRPAFGDHSFRVPSCRSARLLTVSMFILVCVTSLGGCRKQTKDEDGVTVLPQFGKCEATTPLGHLTYNKTTDVYRYVTSGGGEITISVTDSKLAAVTFNHKDYPTAKLELWGYILRNGQYKLAASHESLNGKHIKDRLGNRRTVILPDASKVTLITDGAYGLITSISIYDAAESHHINLQCNTIEYSSTSSAMIRAIDEAEADGETSAIEITAEGLLLVTIYQEDTPGNKVSNRYRLAELIRSSPNTVNDYYDDPRLGHT